MSDFRFFGLNDRCEPVVRSLRPFSATLKGSTFLTAALLLAMAAPAEAQILWPSERGNVVRPERKRVHHARQRASKVIEVAKETSKPVGPVVISISIDKQQLKIYDNNGVFAESPVSTGMPGHPTPQGIFSVIGKEVFHRSNIYSGAPMPHMQRITWSGVAMHEGVLPGRAASHGCIRLPGAFATRMFGWTKVGARVVITPDYMTPVEFSHPRLASEKPVGADPNMPIPAADVANISSTPKLDTAAATPNPELRLTSGSGDGPGKGGEIKTADASGAIPSKSDATADVKVETKPELRTDKDQARPAEADKPVAVAPPPKPLPGMVEFIGPIKPQTGQIAVLVSRKEGKVFVRQNFKPLFDMPVTIADKDKPLGTHLFTVRSEDDNSKLHWTVVSLPTPQRAASTTRYDRRLKKNVVIEAPLLPPASTASEALDRVTIPDAAMKRIAAALTPGGSIVVSDQGLGGETGEGTDFIVQLR